MEHSLQTHPFIQITLNRNGKPKYFCPICNVKGYACTMIDHLNGKKHAKRLWKSSHSRTNKRKFHQRYTTFIRQKQFKKRKLNETKKNRIRKRLIQEQTERVNAKKQIKKNRIRKRLIQEKTERVNAKKKAIEISVQRNPFIEMKISYAYNNVFRTFTCTLCRRSCVDAMEMKMHLEGGGHMNETYFWKNKRALKETYVGEIKQNNVQRKWTEEIEELTWTVHSNTNDTIDLLSDEENDVQTNEMKPKYYKLSSKSVTITNDNINKMPELEKVSDHEEGTVLK
ncbi:MAG: hypothetical protein GY928_35875 [Colwellia sp.]|nr:hypothetical protein [Colwellia sp.]